MHSDTHVTITKLDIPFGNLVWFLVKVSFAAIPAGIVVTIVWGVLASVLAGMFGARLGGF
jgi:hypothetical protein